MEKVIQISVPNTTVRRKTRINPVVYNSRGERREAPRMMTLKKLREKYFSPSSRGLDAAINIQREIQQLPSSSYHTAVPSPAPPPLVEPKVATENALKKWDEVRERSNAAAVPTPSSSSSSSLRKKIIRRTYFLGKGHKNYNILITSESQRQHRRKEYEKWAETSMHDIRSYLLSHNLIQHGSTAPPDLLREMYHNAKSVGTISNKDIMTKWRNYIAADNP